MAGWEATSSLSAVPSFFSLYSSGIFALYFFAQFVFFSGMKQKTTKLMMSGYGQLVIFDILYDSRTMHVH